MIECDRLTVERLGAVVLDRLSHTIHAGQTVAVIGRTAAGKTSLLETLATALERDVAAEGILLLDICINKP